jgi:hypothetical protein
MVVKLKKSRPKGQLDAALKALAKRKRKGARILQFVGKASFEGDPVTIQKEMRASRAVYL